MGYRKMIEEAKQKGLATNEKMWESIASVESFLDSIDNEELKAKFMRTQHEIIYGKHFDEMFANMEIDKIHYTDHDGIERHGAHWSCQEVEQATRGMRFDQSITKHDKWVALNVMYADLNKVLTDEDVIQSAYAFYFDDDDWPNKNCKIWEYVSAKDWFAMKH